MTSLTAIEAAVNQRAVSPNLVSELNTLLTAVNKAQLFFESNTSQNSVISIATRICSLLSSFVTDRRYNITYYEYLDLLKFNEHIRNCFILSGYAGVQHITEHFFNDTKAVFSKNDLMKLFLVLDLETIPESFLQQLRHMPADITVPFCVSLMSRTLKLTEKQTKVYREIVRILKSFDSAKMSHVALIHFTAAYMNCSYDFVEDKHEIKKVINKLFTTYLQSIGISQELSKKNKKAKKTQSGKPVLIVVNDVLTKNHAMFRCYSNSIRKLRQKYKVVSVSQKNRLDEVAEAFFDESLTFDIYKSEKLLPGFIKRLRNMNPVAVYFPSVGMSSFGILLSNLRLAPIQCCTFGHPATTHSPFIDFGIIERDTVVNPSLFSEKLLSKYEGGNFSLTDKHQEILGNLHDKKFATELDRDEVNVSVLGTLFKLNYKILDLCKQIEIRSKKKINWHFFPNSKGTGYWASKKYLENCLESVIVHPTRIIGEYLETLADIDVNIGTFPFGQSNGIVDMNTHCIPSVIMYGEEMHTYLDVHFHKMLNLPEWMIAHTEEALIDNAVKLIEDDELRESVQKQIMEFDLANNAKFLGIESGSVKKDDFPSVIEWMVENSDSLMKNTNPIIEYRSDYSAKNGSSC